MSLTLRLSAILSCCLLAPGSAGARAGVTAGACRIVVDDVVTNAPAVSALFAVDAVSSSDVWAVGTTPGSLMQQDRPLIEHWNGSEWSVAEVPSVIPDAELNDVFARRHNDIWAVGTEGSRGASPRTLVLHYDGVRWTRVQSPAGDSGIGSDLDNTLRAVTAVGSTDVWALGHGAYPNALAMHWNGTRWRILGERLFTEKGSFAAVSAITKQSIWAAGGTDLRSFISHWNGKRWKIEHRQRAYIDSVDARSSRDIWAAGDAGVQHFDGFKWSTVPRRVARLGQLDNVAAIDAPSPRTTWAAGTGGVIDHYEPVLIRRANKRWSRLPVPKSGLSRDVDDISVVSDNEAWLVGSGSLPAQDVSIPESTAVALHAHCTP